MWDGSTPTAPRWSGNPATAFPSYIANLTIGNLISSNITTANLTSYNGYVSYMSNITTKTNAVILQPATILTGNNGALYINGSLVYTASNFSNIGEWSKFAAVSDVNLSFSTITNVGNIFASNTYWGRNLNVSTVRGAEIFSSNIHNSNQITTKSLVGITSVVAPTIEGVNVSGVYGSFPTLSCSDLTSSTQSNLNLLQTRLLRVNDSAQIVGTLNVSLDITGGTVIRVPEMRTTNSFVYTQLRVAPIFPYPSPDTGSIITPSNITTDNLIVRNTATTQTLNVSGNATVDGTASLATATIGNITGNVAMEGNIVFPYNTIGGIVLPPNQQWLYDIQNVRNISCGSLTVVGGATGDEFFPPLHYASEVTIGNDGGLTSQGVVVINGQLPDPANPGTNFTTALTVYGDVQVGSIDPLSWGTLTSYNGTRCIGENPDGLALEVAGIANIVGLTNITGATTIEGATGILGNTTITGAFEVTGGVLVTGGLAQLGGDFTLGAFGTGYTGIINTPLTINNALNMANNDIDTVSVLTAGDVNATNVNATNFITSNILTSNARIPHLSTNTIVVYQDLSGGDIVGGISFSDISGNQQAFIGLSQSDPYPLVLASLNNIATFAVGNVVTDAGVNMQLTAQGDTTLTGVSNVTMQTVGNATVVSGGGTTTVRALNAVSILSDDAGIALEAETGVFMNDNYGASFGLGLGDITATASNINLSATTQINCLTQTTATDLLVGTIRNAGGNIDLQTTDGNLYLGTVPNNPAAYDIYLVGNRNISIFGGNKNGGETNYDGVIKILTGDEIEIRSYDGGNITLDNTTVPIGALNDRNIIITAGCNINMTAGTGRDITFGSQLNMSNNNISNVNKMYYASTRQPFIQFGSNNTGATGITVSIPVPYANATYAVQLTYIGIPSGSQSLYLISQTTSNFRFHGHSNSTAYWTTFGFNN